MGKISKWFSNARSVSLAQSVLPSLLAVVFALGYPGFNIWLALLAVIGVASAHLAMNLADDYFDYKVDMLGDRYKVVRQGFRAMMVKYPYLTDGSETLGSLRRAIASFSAVALLCGAVIFYFRTVQYGLWGMQGSWHILAIVVLAAFLGAFYSAPPLKLAYKGLGELVIGIIFGPLLILGVYYASCAQPGSDMIWISVSVGLLVLNILFTHSVIERKGDEASNKMTFARLLGSDKANLTAAWLINLIPFAMIVFAVCTGRMHPAYLAVLLMLPRSIWLCRSLGEFVAGNTGVPDKPAVWLGAMRNWDKYREAGIDWFMMRWLTARNALSGFCMILMVVKLILLLFGRGI